MGLAVGDYRNNRMVENERSLLNHGTKFEVVPAVEGTGLADVIPARGAAFGDLFNDGKIDVVVNRVDHTPVLLRAPVYLTSGGIPQRSDMMSSGSYISANDQRSFRTGTGDAGRPSGDSQAERSHYQAWTVTSPLRKPKDWCIASMTP